MGGTRTGFVEGGVAVETVPLLVDDVFRVPAIGCVIGRRLAFGTAAVFVHVPALLSLILLLTLAV